MQVNAIHAEKNKSDRKNTLLGPNKNFPFPGDVRCAQQSSTITNGRTTLASVSEEPVKSQKQLSHSKQLYYVSMSVSQMVQRLFEPLNKWEDYKHGDTAGSAEDEERIEQSIQLEVGECPRLLRLALKKIFAEDETLPEGSMTLVNVKLDKEDPLSRPTKTRGRMKKSEVEKRKRLLVEMFITAGEAICGALIDSGFWANFINPRSGMPHYGVSDASFLLDDDKRYQQLGFQVEEHGDCTVIEEKRWDAKTFVGTIFTDAAPDCEVMKKIVEQVNSEEEEEEDYEEGC